ncbi:MAG: hypothetical protein R8M37_02565 [Alphaproteobacteria bacterium]|nr:hypothetical protein [Alphaproteobacteria bacterium]
MKRILLFGVLMMVAGGELMAAQQCVKFGDLSVPLNEYNAEMGGVDWSLVWSYVTVRGIGVCVHTPGELGDVAVSIEYDASFYGSEPNDNSYCWCRMLNPAVSFWVAYGEVDDAEVCAERCASLCADSVLIEPVFKTAMLGSLGG